MKTITFEVANETGIHARPAAFLAQACVDMNSQITIRCGDKTANGNNVHRQRFADGRLAIDGTTALEW